MVFLGFKQKIVENCINKYIQKFPWRLEGLQPKFEIAEKPDP